jgi:hydroxylaminobenzene mutase
MERRHPDRLLIRAGFFLFTLALITGFAIPAFLNQKMALSAHVSGILNGLVLMAVGLAWGLLAMSPLQARLTRGAFLFAAYAGWGTSCLAAAWGTARLTPLSGAGYGAAPWQELIVQALQMAITTVILAGAVSVVYALRPASTGQSSSLPDQR